MSDPMEFISVDPIDGMTQKKPGIVCNLINGKWVTTDNIRKDIVDPMNGEHFLHIPDTIDHSNFINDINLQ